LTVLLFLFLGWFASQFLFNNLVGRAQRADIVLWSLVGCAFVFLISVGVLLKNLMRGFAFPIRSQSDKRILGILCAWLVLTVIAAWVGLRDGNDLNYLLGDFYRFGSVSIVLILFYFWNLTPPGFQRLLRGFVLVYGGFLIVDAILYGSAIKQGIRPATQSAGYAGVIAPLVIYVSLFDPKWIFRLASRLVLLEMFAALIVGQMFAPILSVLFCLGLFLVPTRKASVAMGLALGVGVLFVSVYYADALLSTNLDYLESKIQIAKRAYSTEDFVESLSGVRLGEIRGVLETMRTSPETIPLGTGLGGMVTAETVNIELPWLEYKHYIHSGLNEILYRAGAIGLGLFLSLVVLLFRRGYRLYARGHSFGLIVMVGITNTVLLMSFAGDLTTGLPILALSFAGLNLAERSVPAAHSESNREEVSARRRFEVPVEGGMYGA
jgi:hypothetical protein